MAKNKRFRSIIFTVEYYNNDLTEEHDIALFEEIKDAITYVNNQIKQLQQTEDFKDSIPETYQVRSAVYKLHNANNDYTHVWNINSKKIRTNEE